MVVSLRVDCHNHAIPLERSDWLILKIVIIGFIDVKILQKVKATVQGPECRLSSKVLEPGVDQYLGMLSTLESLVQSPLL